MKEWKKPVLIGFSKENLLKKIVANATSSCSGGCGGCGGCWTVVGWPFC